MKSVRFTEHVPRILALDAEKARQLSSDYNLFRDYIDELCSNVVPGEKAVFRPTGDRELYVKLEEVTNGNDTLGIVMNVTEEITTRRKIEEERDIDLLTGLYNRRGLENRLTRLFEAPDKLGYGALIMVDADGLKGINDQYGHEAGDLCLKEIAGIIRGFGPYGSVSARHGGDEFVLFLYGYETEEDLLDSIDKLKFLRNNSTMQIDEGLTVPLEFSIGYMLTKGRSDYRSMLKQADERMYSIKRERKKAAASQEPAE